MSAERLLARYERVAEAPDAVPRLRRFVLDLAVRGKLVAQEAGEVSPVKLLVEARKQLRAQAETGKRMRWKQTDPVAGDEIDKDVPSGWVAARVNDTGFYINGLAFKPADWKQSGIPIIRIQNLTDPQKEFNYAQGDFPDEVIVRDGDLLVSWSATLEAFKWDRGEGVLNQHIFRVIPQEGLADRGFLLVLLRHAIREMADSEHAHGLVMTHINRGPFLNHVVLIPPLAEQHRIVAKVDELMALLDRLEAARTTREATRDRLTAASLARLTAPDTPPEDFPANARFALATLPALTTRPDQIKPLRQTILNLAVRGKLVEQDPTDETASSLVEMIRSEKKEAKKRSVEPDMTLVDFLVPSHWVWQSLDTILTGGPQNGLSPRKSERTDAPKSITLTATTSGTFDARQFKHVDVSMADAARYWLEPGDLLFQRGNTREYVGMAAVYDGPPEQFLFPDLIMRVQTSPHMDVRFVHLWCIAPFARHFLSSNATGAQQTMPKINQGILRSLPIPLPPLAEQHRIVAKVDALMALCDRLEAALTSADTTRARLLEALLHEALEPVAASA
jgi:type I restriction enzyme S subunit